MTIIVRPFFDPHDVQRLQLGAERLLATGDNSAVESWCARCKLYFYEDVDNGGCKCAFLGQQVALAESISPKLGKALALFGGDSRIGVRPNEPFSDKQLIEMEQLLNDQDIAQSTIQFCNLITTKYSFAPILEGAIKRAVWHHCLPELAAIEAKTIDEPFRRGLILHLKNHEASEKTITIRSIPELKSQVEKAVQEYTQKETEKSSSDHGQGENQDQVHSLLGTGRK